MPQPSQDQPSATAAPRAVVIYAHAAPDSSRVNRRMIDAARALPNVTVRDLYETYPDFAIPPAPEQALLAPAELVVFHFPVQWYSMPALLKEWIDVVFEHGWAHGIGGTALQGKGLWLAATTGGAQSSYAPDGYHGFRFDEFLPPLRQTAALCGMRWLPPLILHDARHAGEDEVARHVERYRAGLATYPQWAPAPDRER